MYGKEIFDGDQFIAFYIKDNEPKATLGMRHDRNMVMLQELMHNGKCPLSQR